MFSESNFTQPHKQLSDSEASDIPDISSRISARSPSPSPKRDQHIASELGNHASERSTYYDYMYVDAVPILRSSPTSGTLSSRALLAQASRERMTSMGYLHPPRIYIFTRIFGRYKPIYNWSNLGGSVAEWLACWTRVQKGPGSNRSRDSVG